MKTFEYTITDEVGIHARPAGLLVKECKELASSVTLTSNGKSADATAILNGPASATSWALSA